MLSYAAPGKSPKKKLSREVQSESSDSIISGSENGGMILQYRVGGRNTASHSLADTHEKLQLLRSMRLGWRAQVQGAGFPRALSQSSPLLEGL